MSNFKLTGILHKKYDRESVSASFSKREFVLKFQDGNYEQFAKFQMTQDRCDFLDNWQEGQGINVSFNIRGREHNGKFFSNLDAWKIEADGTAQPSAAPAKQAEPQPATNGEDAPPASDDSLPF